MQFFHDANSNQILQQKNYREDLQNLRNRLMNEINLKNRNELRYQEQLEEEKQNFMYLLPYNIIREKDKVTQVFLEEIKNLKALTEKLKDENLNLKKSSKQMEEQIENIKITMEFSQQEKYKQFEEVKRTKEAQKACQLENVKLRQEINILMQQKEKQLNMQVIELLSLSIDEYKQQIGQLQMNHQNESKENIIEILKSQLEKANQDINKYRSLLNNSTPESSNSRKLYGGENEWKQKSPVSPYRDSKQESMRQIAYRSQQRFNGNNGSQTVMYFEEQDNSENYFQGSQFQQQSNLKQQNAPLRQSEDYQQTFNPIQLQQERSSSSKYFGNVSKFQLNEQELVQLQLKKDKNKFKLDNDLRKSESSKVRSSNQRKQKQELENELNDVNKQIQGLKKVLRVNKK